MLCNEYGMFANDSVGICKCRGTPCVVGPAGNIYKGFPELELYLVEKEVDNPTAIRNRLQLVRDNYGEIKVLLNAFVLEYNSRLELIKEKMYKELKQ